MLKNEGGGNGSRVDSRSFDLLAPFNRSRVQYKKWTARFTGKGVMVNFDIKIKLLVGVVTR